MITRKGFFEWAAHTPLLVGIRSVVGRVLTRFIEAKHGTALFYDGLDRTELFEHVREIKRETRTLLHDVEAMFIYEVVRSVAKIPGDIAEVGTYRGGSARLMAEASEGKKPIHTFDTFEGLPPLVDFDAKRFSEGQFATSEEAVRDYLKPYPSIHVYKGLFPDTAGPVEDKKFSFVHLDVDIYQSTLNGLKFFYPRMNKGGVIVSHDHSNAEGVRRAFDEFFADKPEAIVSLPGTQCLVVKG